METCATDGNLGFPISITGTLSAGDQNFLGIQGNSEIVTSFATRMLPRKLIRQSVNETGETQRNIIDEGQENTLLYKGKRFTLIHIQITAADFSGTWPYTPKGKNAANAVFIYSRLFSQRDGPQAVILTVPLYEKESMENLSLQSPKATMYFEDALAAATGTDIIKPRVPNVGDLFREFANPGYVTYATCIPVRSTLTTMSTLNVLAAYFPSGWILSKQLIESIGDYNYRDRSRYSPFFLPNQTRNSFPTAVREPPPTPATDWIQNIDNWSDKGETFKNTISVSSPQFTVRFLWIAAGILAGDTTSGGGKRLKTTVEYQCMPLDKVKDIDGKYVLLDPATGERTLTDALEGGEQKAEIEMALKQGDSLKTFATVLGIIFGLIVGVLLLSFAVRYILKRQPEVDVVAVANAAIPPVT
jgi:hypothetical protein